MRKDAGPLNPLPQVEQREKERDILSGYYPGSRDYATKWSKGGENRLGIPWESSLARLRKVLSSKRCIARARAASHSFRERKKERAKRKTQIRTGAVYAIRHVEINECRDVARSRAVNSFLRHSPLAPLFTSPGSKIIYRKLSAMHRGITRQEGKKDDAIASR